MALIGAQAAFPVMIFETGVNYVTFVPGLIATGLPMLFIFLLPVLPIHRRMVAAKQAALEASGVIDHYAEERARPIGEHLADFEDYML